MALKYCLNLAHSTKTKRFVSPTSNLYIEILIPSGMVLGGGAFGKLLGQEGGDLMNGINGLRVETKRDLPFLPPCAGTARRHHSVNPEAGSHQTLNRLVPSLWTSQPPEQ